MSSSLPLPWPLEESAATEYAHQPPSLSGQTENLALAETASSQSPPENYSTASSPCGCAPFRKPESRDSSNCRGDQKPPVVLLLVLDDMHSGDLAELGGANLSEAEREALLEVMQRAKVNGNL